MQLDSFSRFKNTDLVIVNGEETFARWVPPLWLSQDLDPSDIFTFYVTVATEGRPDLIANAVYGTPLLDWVLIAYNQITDTVNWPKAGTLIRYPSDTIVLPSLL